MEIKMININERLPDKGKPVTFFLKNGESFVGQYHIGAVAIGSISDYKMQYDFEDWDNGFEPILGWEDL